MALHRRDFLRVGAWAAGALAIPSVGASAQGPAVTGAAARKAKNLIFMVSDGMSFGTLTLADLASRKRFDRPSHWVSLFGMPGVRRCAQGTGSASSIVTDSAAAASAWGCGHKVRNGTINITPDGVQRLPLLVRARQAGKATGVVSTARVTHATPAGFYANSPQRSLENDIAIDLVERGIDVALGGGARHFPEKLLSGQNDLAVVRTKAELSELDPKAGQETRWLGLFSSAHMPFENDRVADEGAGKPATVPTLAAMSKAAIARLSSLPKGNDAGFVLQIEGGRIDHAAHNNDAGTLVSEQLAFDEALGEVVAWIRDRDDTLLVVTTDHGNANPGMTVYDGASFKAFDRLLEVRRSFDWITDEVGKKPVENQIMKLPAAVEAATGIALKASQVEMMKRVMSGERVMPFDGLNLATSVLGGILANSLGVGFVSGHHTADRVELTTWGPGSERFAGEIENDAVHGVLADALALPPGTLLEGMDQIVRPKAQDPND